MAENNACPSSALQPRSNASIRSRACGRIPGTLQALNSADTDARRSALAEAVHSFDDGQVTRPQDTGWVNLLARTFFSYSADGFSPSRLAWEAVIRGLSAIGSADVDNLGALGEMHAAGDALGIRTTVSMETTTFVQSYADREINCPGHSGFLRVLGAGFTAVPSLDTEHGRLIAALPVKARDRNLAMITKVNPMLAPVGIEFEGDVVPLTAAGNATVGHIAAAYANKAAEKFPDAADLSVFWADVLGRSPNDVKNLLAVNGAFLEVLRDRIVALVDDKPSPASYPGVTEFFRAVRASGAVPCLYWQDGRLPGESDPGRLLDDAVTWGAHAVAVAPDACWNIADAGEKEKGLAALKALMAAARERNLPVLPGSPMSASRQKFVDSFDAPELSAYFREFTEAAFWLYGHVTLERSAGLGYESEWAEHAFDGDRAAANAFYIEVGKKAFPGKAVRVRIAQACPGAAPADIMDALSPARS